MNEHSIDLLRELSDADGVPGHESEVRDIFRRRLADVGPIGTDRLGSAYCTKEGASTAPRILLDSHLDEVGFIVQRVTSRGYVKFVAAGGWWPHTLPAQRVRIATQTGKIDGVIGAKPPHLLSEAERNKVMRIEDLHIDVGASSGEQATQEFGIRPGCPVAPATAFSAMQDGNVFSGKALDNRLGVALVIEALLVLGDHPNCVIGAGCVQEEVGLRGARTLAPQLEADVALILEGPPADDTPGFEPEAMQGKLGGGVQIRLFDPTMIANPKLAALAIDTAREHNITHQVTVRSSGGTNAGAIHQTGRGVPSVVLGVPARYIHSHVSIMHLDDYRAALELLLRLIPRLDRSTVDSLSD